MELNELSRSKHFIGSVDHNKVCQGFLAEIVLVIWYFMSKVLQPLAYYALIKYIIGYHCLYYKNLLNSELYRYTSNVGVHNNYCIRLLRELLEVTII